MSCSTIYRLQSNTSERAVCALGVSSPMPLDFLPEVPAVAETVPGLETAAFAGIGAQKDTSAIDKLKAEVNAGLADPVMGADHRAWRHAHATFTGRFRKAGQGGKENWAR